MKLKLDWEFVADTVMGGVSQGRIDAQFRQGRSAMRLTGKVSLDNDGGFIQMAADLNPSKWSVRPASFSGVEVDSLGNAESYDLRLRTTDLTRPWQSYRAAFTPRASWGTYQFPFDALTAHRTDVPFNPGNLCRLGIVAVGRAFAADVSVAAVRLCRA